MRSARSIGTTWRGPSGWCRECTDLVSRAPRSVERSGTVRRRPGTWLGARPRISAAPLRAARCVLQRIRGTQALLHIERLGALRLAGCIEGDLLDARLGLAQQLLAAALEDLAALVDRDRFLERDLALLEPPDDRLQLLDRLLEGKLADVCVVGFGHAADPGARDSAPRLTLSSFSRSSSAQSSSAHQGDDVGADRLGEALKVVAAFEHRDDAAVAVFVGDLHELARHPGEVGLQQVEVGERVARVGVEAGGDDDKVRLEALEPRQDHGLERLAELLATVAGAQRRIDDVVVLA